MAMGITQALKLQEGPIDALARLPQQQLIQMSQQGRIPADILPVILNEKAQMAQQMANMQAAQQPQPPSIIEQAMATNAQAEAQMQPRESGIANLPVPEDMYSGGEEGYAGGGIVAFSNRGYVEPSFADAIQRLETGGYRGNPNFAVSPKGAMGLMQILPTTAMKPGYGVKNIFDLADQLGIDYEDRSEGSAKKLLTNPTINRAFGENYLGAMSDRFGGDPSLVAASYNAGPGAVIRAGGVPDYPETQKYVAGISPERFESARKSVQDARREQLKNVTDKLKGPVPENLGSTFDPYLQATAPTPPAGPTKEDVDARQQEFADYLFGRRPITPASPEMAKVAKKQRKADEKPAPETPEAVDNYADLRKYISDLEKSNKSQSEEDKYMALLAAGLGIMGGQSPYAFSNIGAGGLKGVEYAAQARKSQREREKDLLAGRLELSKSEMLDRYYGGQLARKDVANQLAAGRLGAVMQGNLLKARKQFMEEGGADAIAAEFEAIHGKNWRKSEKLKGQYELAVNARIRDIAGGMGAGSARSARSLLDLEDEED